MRITIITLLVACVASPASAELVFYEGFDYAVGETPTSLNGQTHLPSGNQWLKPTAPSGDYSVVGPTSVGYPGLPEPTGNSASVPRGTSGGGGNGQVRITIPGQPYARADGGSLFFSFTLQMTNWVNFATDVGDSGAKSESGRRGGFVAGFFGGPASTTTAMSLGQSFAAPIYIRRQVDYSAIGTDGTPGAQTGLYEIGIQKRATAQGLFDPVLQNSRGVIYDETVSYAVGQTVLIVGEYKFVDTEINQVSDIARLWVNPTPGDFAAEATPTVADDVIGSPNIQGGLPLASFHLRNDTNLPGNVLIDELRIGTTFADVIPAGPAGLPGDFNDNQIVDGNDFLVWQRGESPTAFSLADLQAWKDNFGSVAVQPAVGAVPEPTAAALAVLGGVGLLSFVRRRRN